MSISQALLAEFDHEAASTRKMLEVIPEDQLEWAPHEKSMTLARLAGHIAEIPAWAGNMVGQDELDMGGGNYQPVMPGSIAELLEAHDSSVAAFKGAVSGADDATLMQPWTFRTGDQVHFQMPCVIAMRSFILNHIVHHRGQLSVYLRHKDVPLPQVYGPTADNQSF
ncbi:MAG: DinB family protein [Acidobacteriota bacterium]